MKQAFDYLRGLRRSVKRHLPGGASPRPELDQRPLLRALMTGPQGGVAARDAQLAVQYFRQRPPNVCFLSTAEALEAAADYGRDRVDWRQALLDETERLCRQGLPVYAAVAGPLDGGLDWGGLAAIAPQDRLYRLRPHRFGFLPRMALAACLGSDCLSALHASLEGWIRDVESTGGVEAAYYSNLVIIYRLLAITWAAPFIAARAGEGDKVAVDLCLLLFRILAADVQYLMPRLGDSAPNNHLLADRFAGWFIAVCHSELCANAAAKGAAETLEQDWQDELARQFQNDGSNFEQSLHYHELGCEMALAYLAISLRRGTAPAGQTLALISRMLRFQAAMADGHGKGFSFGDSTDDPLLPLDSGGSWARGAWRMLYCDLFDRGFPGTSGAAVGAERAYWLLATMRGVPRPLQLSEAPLLLSEFVHFTEIGCVVFREESADQHLLFRCGPRPDSSVSPGHAMADLLSVYWNAKGRAVLEPGGTCTYAAVAPNVEKGPVGPRDYFRSPAAHNGPVLAGHDPLGSPTGRFRVSDNETRVSTRSRALNGVLAWAEASLREPGPLNSWRRGVLRLPQRLTLVYDRPAAMVDAIGLACHWQFAPEATVVARSERQLAVMLPELTAFLATSRGIASIEVVRGRREPPAGWVSRRYGQVKAAPQAICRLDPGANAVAFAFGLSDGEELPKVEILAADEDGLAVMLQRGNLRDYAVFGRLAGGGGGKVHDLDFDGEALWLSFEAERCLELRALGLQRLSSAALGLEVRQELLHQACSDWTCIDIEAGQGGLCGHWKSVAHG